MLIRPANNADWPAIWEALEPAIREGETYALDRSMTEAQAKAWWMAPGHEVSVAVADGAVLGTSFLRPYQPGPVRTVTGTSASPARLARAVPKAR